MGFRVLKAAIVCALLGAWPTGVYAQVASEPAVKAAFLLNFVKFTEWPEDVLPPGAPVVMCLTDNAVANALEQIVVGKTVDGHPLFVSRVKVDGALRACGLLYVRDLDGRRWTKVLEGIKGASVLSVGDIEEFNTLGGVVRLLIEDGRMHFAINIVAADQARLKLSAKLMNLAKAPTAATSR
jgi:hypothetical protein